MATLIPRAADGSDWQDDPAVRETDQLIRFVITGWHISKVDDGTFEISPKAFAAMGPGVSVELERLYAALSKSAVTRLTEFDGLAARGISASSVRSVAKYDTKGKPTKGCMAVCYTPNQEGGYNPFHCDLFPKPSKTAQRDLLQASNEVVALDQAKAAARYARDRKI